MWVKGKCKIEYYLLSHVLRLLVFSLFLYVVPQMLISIIILACSAI